MLAAFVGLIVGPIVAGSFINVEDQFDVPLDLYQPAGIPNNDTRGTTETGTGAPDYSGYLATRSGLGSATETAAS